MFYMLLSTVPKIIINISDYGILH